MSTPSSILVATSLGLSLSTAFTIGSLSLSYFAIPAILLPSNAPLIPPLELVTAAKKRHFRTEPAPKQPLDSGIGDETESLLDAGGSSKILSNDGSKFAGSPSPTSYLLRQWFHLFSKGMHNMPPATLGAAVCYVFCAVMLPGELEGVVVKRAFYAVAAVFSVGVMAFTLTVLEPTNKALHGRVKEVVEREREGVREGTVDDKREETEGLIRKWGKMNAIRSILPVLAVVNAVVALAI